MARPDRSWRLPRRAIVERVVLSAGVAALFIAGYFGVGGATDAATAWELATPLDARIPFVPWTVWIYLSVFPTALLPLFVVRCPDLFRRTLAAYAATIAASLAIFVAFPVTSASLRVDPKALDPSIASEYAVATLYAIDPPFNLFPSLHLSVAALAAYAAWKGSRAYGAAAFAGVALIGVSITTVKQHFVADGLAGLALAALTAAPTIARYRPGPGYSPAFSRRGLVAFAAFLALVQAGFRALHVALR